ncbi:acyl-CoA dehydrogenase [Gordonia sp. TBRC 11910]|uniref:Acyl-CoA dehydrogenase n=1 Tax=Gordonia asplenii TaxID=2725283 RepID=A0A848KP79_9ACTN|nr:acyl-CoA dehydrogenase family protein [Gordonia asplenii]NMO00042.1 acyl-CoA dehydrogenase [Gordonia asplenii]
MVFSEEHEAFRASIRGFVDRDINPYVDQWEEAGIFPAHELFKKAGDIGILGIEYDEEYGGMGADHTFAMIAQEEFGRVHAGGIPMALGVQMMMATPALHRFGTHELKEKYLRPAIAGDMVTAIAVTEPDAGSDVAALRTKAVRDGDDWVINGSKMFITNGTQADWMCLLARTSAEGGHRGMSQIIVERDTPGVVIGKKLDKLGCRCSDTALLFFNDVRVPVSNTIGEIGRGFQQQMSQFIVERMSGAYSKLKKIEWALEQTRDYMRDRIVRGEPLISNQYAAFQLAELSGRLDMLRTYCYAMAEKYSRGEDTTREATIAKLMGSRLCRDTAHWVLQFHGGTGYIEESWVPRFVRDIRLAGIGGGADEVMLQVLAKIDGFTPA